MKKSLKLLILAPWLLSMQFAQAQSTAMESKNVFSYTIDEIVQRYPADSIQSTEKANEALKDVSAARTKLDARLAAEEQVCYPKFFTTSCLNKAAERKRLDLLSVRAIEIEANAYIRHARVEKRDRKLEEAARERNAKNAVDPILVQPKPAAGDPTAEVSGTEEAKRKARAEAYVKKNEDHAKRQQELQQKEQSGAAERAANVEKYEEKQKEAEKRQKEIAERKAEKDRIEAGKSLKENAGTPTSGK